MVASGIHTMEMVTGGIQWRCLWWIVVVVVIVVLTVANLMTICMVTSGN